MHTFLGSGMHASMHGMHPVEDSDMRQRAPKTNLPLIDFAICHRVCSDGIHLTHKGL